MNYSSRLLATSGLLLSTMLRPTAVIALELVIESNGSDSVSTVAVSQTTQQTVSQNNQTSSSNSVDITANTGNNEISDSSSESNIITGDIQQEITITQVLNNSVVDTECCVSPSNSSIEIVNNGSGSTNLAEVSNAQTSTITINQQAVTRNEISSNLNTGNNSIHNNGGDTTIRTGSISDRQSINTTANKVSVNTSWNNQSGNVSIKISGNGSDSTNHIALDLNNNHDVMISNYHQSILTSLTIANTGNNTISDSLGIASIITGDISIEFESITLDNQSEYLNDGCCNIPDPNGDDDKDPEEPVVNPPNPSEPPVGNPPVPPYINGTTSSTSGPSTGSQNLGGAGQVLGAAASAILPATGMSQFWLLFGLNILMIVLGGYLRLRSGRSPALAYATI